MRHVLIITGVALLFAASADAQVLNFQAPAIAASSPNAAEISSDGKFVYVANGLDDAITMYARDTTTGALTLRQTYQNNANGISGLINPWALALNPDQTRLYVVNQGSLRDAIKGVTYSDTLLVFNRDPKTGELTFIETHTNNTNGVSGIAGPVSMAVSPNGAHVYVAGWDDNAVAVFARSTSGGLTFVESYKNGDGDIDAMQKPSSVVLSPDGAQLYVTAYLSDAVVTFARDAATGKLQWKQQAPHNSAGLFGARALVASADGKFIYVAGTADDTIAVLVRDVQTGMLSLSAAAPVKNGADGVSGLAEVSALAMSADGFKLYAVSPDDNALTVFQRNPLTGALTLIESHIDGANGVDALQGVFALAASADGAHVYTLSTDKLGVFAANSANRPPVATDDAVSMSIPNESSITIWVTANDTDINRDDVLSVATVDTLSEHRGKLEISRESQDVTFPLQYVIYTPAPGFTGVDTFSYTVADDTGERSSAARVTVTVTAAVTPSGNGPVVDANATKKKGGGSIDLWSLLCLVGCIAYARAHRRLIFSLLRFPRNCGESSPRVVR